MQRVSEGSWIMTLFSPDHMNTFLITIPSLLMVMFGFRKLAAIYFFGSCLYLLAKYNA